MSLLRRFNRVAWCGTFFAAGIAATVARAQTVVPAAPATSPGPAGTLPEDLLPELKSILKHALERSPDTIKRGLDLEQAEAHTAISRGAMLPSLGANARYAVNSAATASGNSSATSNSSGFFWQADFSQPLYQWGTLKAQADIDQLSVKIAAREYAEAYRRLATLVREKYLELIAKKAALTAAKLQLDLGARQLVRDEEQFKTGALTPGDMAGKRMGFEERKLGFDRAAGDFAYFRRVFMRLAGLEEFTDEAIPVAIPAAPPAADKGDGLLHAFLRDKAAETFQGQIYSLNIRQSDLNYKIADYWLWPRFSFNAGHSVSNSTQADFNQVRQEAIVQNYYGIVVNWPIFDGFATRGRKLEALTRKRANERQLQFYVDATADTAQYLRDQAEFAARALGFAEARLAGAKAGVELAKENLARKIASQDDVDLAAAGLLGTEAATMLARADYLSRWAEFVSLVGADPAMNNLPPRYVR